MHVIEPPPFLDRLWDSLDHFKPLTTTVLRGARLVAGWPASSHNHTTHFHHLNSFSPFTTPYLAGQARDESLFQLYAARCNANDYWMISTVLWLGLCPWTCTLPGCEVQGLCYWPVLLLGSSNPKVGFLIKLHTYTLSDFTHVFRSTKYSTS